MYVAQWNALYNQFLTSVDKFISCPEAKILQGIGNQLLSSNI